MGWMLLIALLSGFVAGLFGAVIGSTFEMLGSLLLTIYLQAALVMAVGLLVYLVYLIATKKGSLKTKSPMGPYLSLGVIVTVLFPMFGELSETVFSSLF